MDELLVIGMALGTVLIGLVVYAKLSEKKAFIESVCLLFSDFENKIGDFIEPDEEDNFLGKTQILAETVTKRGYTFKEAVDLINFKENLPKRIYDNNVDVLEKKITDFLDELDFKTGGGKEYIVSPSIEPIAQWILLKGNYCADRMADYIEGSNVIQKFFNIYAKPIDYLNRLNTEYCENEKSECAGMFNDIDGKSLDENQRDSVVNDDYRQLVIAGAGSGKTLTVSAKVKYLVERKHINPKDILLISFTRKAADEMGERIQKLGIDVESSTFHKYGLSVIRNVNMKTPEVAEDLKVYIDKYIKEKVLNDSSLAKIS